LAGAIVSCSSAQFQASGAAGFEIEGRLLYGAEGVDVGHRLKVQLLRTDVEKGYIDFKKEVES
jgi:hypothetical protein